MIGTIVILTTGVLLLSFAFGITVSELSEANKILDAYEENYLLEEHDCTYRQQLEVCDKVSVYNNRKCDSIVEVYLGEPYNFMVGMPQSKVDSIRALNKKYGDEESDGTIDMEWED